MNLNQQPTGNDQARNAQSSDPTPRPVSITASEAARLLAARRSELRQQNAPTAPEPVAGRAPAPDTETFEAEAVEDSAAEDFDETAELAPDGDEQSTDDEGTYGDDAVLDLDGEEVSLKEIKEWREGQLRQADYQRKTQVLAQKAEAIGQLEERLNSFSHAINRDFQMRMEQAARAMRPFAEIDWAKLAGENPAQYNQKRVQFSQAQAAAMEQQQRWQAFVQEYQQLSQQALQMKAQAALPELKTRIKGWNDALYAERMSFVNDTYAADKATVSKVTDPWFWEMVNDAYLYRKGKSLPTEGKVKRAMPRPLQKGTGTRVAPQAQAAQQLKALPPTAPQSQREALGIKLLQERRQKARALPTRR